MSFSISLSGHVEGDADSATARESEILAAASKLAEESGATGTFSGQYCGYVPLPAPAEPTNDGSGDDTSGGEGDDTSAPDTSEGGTTSS